MLKQIDMYKFRSFLQFTNQEDLEFFYEYTLNRNKREEDRHTCVANFMNRNYYSVFQNKEMLEYLYFEYVINNDFNFCLVFEEFVEYCIVGMNSLLTDDQMEFAYNLLDKIKYQRKHYRAVRNHQIVLDFINYVTKIVD